MSELASVLDTAVRLGRILDELAIPYLIGGSVASSILGERRFTNDLDVALQIKVDQVAGLAARLEPDFLVDAESLLQQARAGGSWNIVDLKTGLKVDLFLKGDMLGRSAFARRRRIPVTSDGDAIWLPTVEDMILRKLLWWVEGGCSSERQWRDVVQMIRLNRRLDDEYMNKWADWLDVTGHLAKARADAGSH